MPWIVSLIFVFAASFSPLAASASECFALAERQPQFLKASSDQNALAVDDVRISFIGHSSFVIESPSGTKIITDYNGNSGGLVPDAVTMNRVHRTHYTDTPDPNIRYVLRGWNEDGSAAVHNIEIGDIRVRNVTTDLRGYSGIVKDGNSIFVFEVAGLCIGHLGHLHHALGPEYIARIGRLDIVMVPVDGSYTMSQSEMAELLQTLKTRIILPMHYFGPTTLNGFLSNLDQSFKIKFSSIPHYVVSRKTLPPEPNVIVLPGN